MFGRLRTDIFLSASFIPKGMTEAERNKPKLIRSTPSYSLGKITVPVEGSLRDRKQQDIFILLSVFGDSRIAFLYLS